MAKNLSQFSLRDWAKNGRYLCSTAYIDIFQFNKSQPVAKVPRREALRKEMPEKLKPNSPEGVCWLEPDPAARSRFVRGVAAR